ncbi:MAG TPA: hypothetical protein QF564_05540 [Pirellulaceae bacterium]|nr:hypothetical protein [Pirellulaceae bacterium]
MLDAIKGIIFAAVLGGLAGLGACVWLFTENLLFTGNAALVGAVVCGILGHRAGYRSVS